jgi:hypothetical protein
METTTKALIAVAAALAAATAAPAATSDSGVAGTVRAGRCVPMPPRRPCAAPAALEIRRAENNVLVRRLRVRAGSRFRVPLSPGSYGLRLVATTKRLVAARIVTIRPHAYTFVVLTAGRG